MLNDSSRSVEDARILVLGVAYKPDVGDVRESPGVMIMQLLHQRGAEVRFHDPYVDEVPLNGGMTVCVEDLDTERRGGRRGAAADAALGVRPRGDRRERAGRAGHSERLRSDRRPNIVPL